MDYTRHDVAAENGRRKLLRVPDIVREYGGSRAFWYALTKRGGLAVIRVGRVVFVDRADLERFLARHRVGGE